MKMKPEEQARADFEAWFEKRGVWPRLSYEEIWLAAYAQARREALEEAAKRCTNTMLMNVESYCGATAHTCADAIRALIKD